MGNQTLGRFAIAAGLVFVGVGVMLLLDGNGGLAFWALVTAAIGITAGVKVGSGGSDS